MFRIIVWFFLSLNLNSKKSFIYSHSLIYSSAVPSELSDVSVLSGVSQGSDENPCDRSSVSGSGEAERSSEPSSEDIEKKKAKVYNIAKELLSTEIRYVANLHLIDQVFIFVKKSFRESCELTGNLIHVKKDSSWILWRSLIFGHNINLNCTFLTNIKFYPIRIRINNEVPYMRFKHCFEDWIWSYIAWIKC